jgi:ribokinase
MAKILIVGSLNMDFVIDVDEMPKVGETIICEGFELFPGGKGANQAYAVGKLGGEVSMIGAVGKDVYGEKLIENLKSAGVITKGIEIMGNCNTGTAFITVNKIGENSIIVIPGANNSITKETIDKNITLIDDCDIVVMQLEIPIEIVMYVATIAKQKGKTVILDPAPAPKNLPDELLKNIDIIKPNETELKTLTGIDTDCTENIVQAARILINKGVGKVIVTLGSRGSMLITDDTYKPFKVKKVKVIDSTAAGDSFTAAFALCVAKGKTCEEAIEFANRVSTIVVTRKGAQTSIPNYDEVVDLEKYILD